MKKLAVLFGILLAFSILWSATAQEATGFKIIVHPDNPATTISKSEASNLFLKKKSRWNGLAVAPVDLGANSSVREAFSETVHGRSVSSIKNYWQRQIFSGREVPPPEMGSDAEVINHVRSNPGGIGYVSPGARLSGVKELNLTN